MKPKIKILLELYESQLLVLTDVECMIEALKRLPEDMKLQSRLVQIAQGLPPVKIDGTVGDRIRDLERDKKVLDVRLEEYKKQLSAIPGGAEEFNNWEDGKLESK